MTSPANDNRQRQWSDRAVTGLAWTTIAIVLGLFWTSIGWMAGLL